MDHPAACHARGPHRRRSGSVRHGSGRGVCRGREHPGGRGLPVSTTRPRRRRDGGLRAVGQERGRGCRASCHGRTGPGRTVSSASRSGPPGGGRGRRRPAGGCGPGGAARRLSGRGLGWSPVAGSSRSGTFRAAGQGSGPDAALSDTGECARAVGGEPACLREAHLGEERGEVSALRPAASSPRGPRLRIRGSGPEPGRGRREPASARDGNHRPTTVPERRGGTAAVAP